MAELGDKRIAAVEATSACADAKGESGTNTVKRDVIGQTQNAI
jgi:hypothetical protein